MAWQGMRVPQWLKSFRKADKPAAAVMDRDARSAAERLVTEIRDAHREWVHAHHRFEHAQGQDQIDYAIFAIEAAEKRYEMLLRQAKGMNASWPDIREASAG